MKFTTEILILLHDRVREACIAKWDIDFDYFKIYEDGSIVCYYTPSYSYAEEESFDINLSDLEIENLDKLILDRKQREKEVTQKREEEQRIANERRIIREKQEREALYLKLKKEFEV